MALLLPAEIEQPQQAAEDIVSSVSGALQLFLCMGQRDPEPAKRGLLRILERVSGLKLS